MLTVQTLIDLAGSQGRLAGELNEIVAKLSRVPGEIIGPAKPANGKLIHRWKRYDAVPRGWLPIVVVYCRAKGLPVDADSVVSLAGGARTLAHGLLVTGQPSESQQNRDTGRPASRPPVPVARGRARD